MPRSAFPGIPDLTPPQEPNWASRVFSQDTRGQTVVGETVHAFNDLSAVRNLRNSKPARTLANTPPIQYITAASQEAGYALGPVAAFTGLGYGLMKAGRRLLKMLQQHTAARKKARPNPFSTDLRIKAVNSPPPSKM